MSKTAKLFTNGRSQAVRLPREFRFDGKEVFIRKDPASGDVVLSKRPGSWDEFFALRSEIEDIPEDWLGDRAGIAQDRDPFG